MDGWHYVSFVSELLTVVTSLIAKVTSMATGISGDRNSTDTPHCTQSGKEIQFPEQCAYCIARAGLLEKSLDPLLSSTAIPINFAHASSTRV